VISIFTLLGAEALMMSTSSRSTNVIRCKLPAVVTDSLPNPTGKAGYNTDGVVERTCGKADDEVDPLLQAAKKPVPRVPARNALRLREGTTRDRSLLAMATRDDVGIEFTVNGRHVVVADEGSTLLDVLRDELGVISVKDGCSPQGQCGCCTVLVDGQPRVSCVTPVRRVRGREVTTVEGLEPSVADAWARAFHDTGGSQCGFCTPGIICRFEGLRAKGIDPQDRDAAAKSLQAHLCRCTGWQTVVDTWSVFGADPVDRPDRGDSQRRAALEGGSAQVVDPSVALGRGGFADDTAPPDSLVAVPVADGTGWIVAETRAEAHRLAGKVQGRRTSGEWGQPLEIPDGDWDVSLATSWVEPAYLETDASWCEPGGEPVSPLANGGAFGSKIGSEVAEVARRLADEHGRVVRVLYAREDAVRRGPKRPPIAAGLRRDGTGILRVARTSGIAAVIHAVLPDVEVQECDIAGPATSLAIRGAGWVEAEVLAAGIRGEVGWIRSPSGGSATAGIGSDRSISVEVRCGEVLDEIVLRSYCIGAAHMALSWVTSESLAVDDSGEIHDLTIRSFGVLRAIDTPRIDVMVADEAGPAVNGSDAVLAAVAAAVWLDLGLAPRWPHTL